MTTEATLNTATAVGLILRHLLKNETYNRSELTRALILEGAPHAVVDKIGIAQKRLAEDLFLIRRVGPDTWTLASVVAHRTPGGNELIFHR